MPQNVVCNAKTAPRFYNWGAQKYVMKRIAIKITNKIAILR
jgi:hypothetical protein